AATVRFLRFIGIVSCCSRPRRDGNASRTGIAHVGFDHEDNLRSREFIISWLTPTPHALAVYDSCSASPPPHATFPFRRPARRYLRRTCNRLKSRQALPGAFLYSITSSARTNSV